MPTPLAAALSARSGGRRDCGIRPGCTWSTSTSSSSSPWSGKSIRPNAFQASSGLTDSESSFLGWLHSAPILPRPQSAGHERGQAAHSEPTCKVPARAPWFCYVRKCPCLRVGGRRWAGARRQGIAEHWGRRRGPGVLSPPAQPRREVPLDRGRCSNSSRS